MSAILLSLHKALITRLRADATLTALIPGGVHSGTVPPTNPRPYLGLNSPTGEPGVESFGGVGRTATMQFDAYSASTVKTPEVVLSILARVDTLLRTPLALEGHTTTVARLENTGVLVEEDQTRHGWARYEFTAAETP